MMVDDLLVSFVATPSTAGVFLDFDGVLADITHTSNGAVVRPEVPALLLCLQARLGRVTIISGRPVDYLADMIPVEIDIVGLYGLEWRVGGVNHTLDEAEQWRDVVSDLTDAAIAEFGESVVEHKGLSLTVHYRGDSGRAESMGRWVDAQSARTGLEARSAKQSYELHPQISRDKGTALLELAESLDPVVFMGDDVGDLPAFDGLDVLASRGVSTLRIGVLSEESPPSLLERADHVVDGPEGAETFLRRVCDLVG